MTSTTRFSVVLILGNFSLKYKFPMITANKWVSHSGFNYIWKLISKDVAENTVVFQKNNCFKPDTFLSEYYVHIANYSTQLYSMKATGVSFCRHILKVYLNRPRYITYVKSVGKNKTKHFLSKYQCPSIKASKTYLMESYISGPVVTIFIYTQTMW